MDRRSWPWKKKSSESKAESSDSPVATRNHEHDEQHTVTRLVLPDSTHNLQQLEEKNRILSEKLSLAVNEITSKDNLVKQHAKVAEEAVSGWEKAEKEATSLKKQLDAITRQKALQDDRVSHLEGALKECVRELRVAREEHDQKLSEALLRKSNEWDNIRLELARKLANANDKIIELEAQKNGLSKLLQERGRTITELIEAKSRAEVEASIVKVEKEELEKTCAKFKYEVQVLAKEVEIRNEENNFNKKAADSMSKHQLENVKKIARLEAECQRLKGLVRKKLPTGATALAHMRTEVDGANWRAKPKVSSSPDSIEETDSKEGNGVNERLMAMEEETKMLKEALAKKNQELQSARLMCAKTASKLSLVEDQLEKTGGTPDKAKSNVNGNNFSSDSWASALVHQLEQFKREKEGGTCSEKLFESSEFDLMDDFAEMERLATTSPDSTSASESGVAIHDERISYEERILELRKKLASAEEQLNNSQKQTNFATDVDRLFTEARDRRPDKLQSAVKRLIQVMESLAAQETGLSPQTVDEEHSTEPVKYTVQWNDPDMELSFKRLISAANSVLQGKVDVLEFITELYTVLDLIQFRQHSNSEDEYNNLASLQEEHNKLRSEKASIEQDLQVAMDRIERLKSQLAESENLVSNLRVQLRSTEEAKHLAENELLAMVSVKAELESKVRASRIEMCRLQDNITALESELQEQRQRHEKTVTLEASDNSGSPLLTEDAARLQESEIAAAAEKLADCQRTIMALGKQLHTLSLPTTGSSRGSMDFSEHSEESDDEDTVHWKVQRSVSDMSRIKVARENIRKQEVYWSSTLSPALNNVTNEGAYSPVEDRTSASSKNSGFSRFFHKRGGLH